MSLDRQRILSELGSVMNQLKSADCGCMGKLFSNQNQHQSGAMGSQLPTWGGCRRGYSHGHGYNYGTPCAGEAYSMNHALNRPCMGCCNPPKLYTDTYNYLNSNLMQPVMKEVYDDLKSINPSNTVMNNPLGTQMGLSQGNPNAMPQGNIPNSTMGMQNIMPGMESTYANSMNMEQSGQPKNPMGGMGPQIVNMIMGEGGTKRSNVQGMQGGQLPTNNVPQYDLTQNGPNPNISSFGGNQAQNMTTPLNHQGNMGPSYSQNPTTQYMTQQQNMYSGNANPMSNTSQNVTPQSTPQIGNMSNTIVSGSPQMGSGNSPAQKMVPGSNQYGQHTQGVIKFNEMFPGVMQDGDLGFDPMAIAIQMNPANQKQAAMDTMQKLMNGGPMSKTMDQAVMGPVMDATKTAMQSINPPSILPQAQSNQYVIQIDNPQVLTGQQGNMITSQNTNQQVSGQQQVLSQNSSGVVSSQPTVVQQKQQVYTALTGEPLTNQQQLQQQQQTYQQQPNQTQSYQQQPNQIQQYQQPQNQYITDPNTGATLTPPTMPTGYNEGVINSNTRNAQIQPSPESQSAPQTMTMPPQTMIKEPIFPADTSRNRPYNYYKPVKQLDYNTLGQPVEMLPARMFHPPEPGLPQTLSPQPATNLRNDYMRYSNVKSTVSKTSLMGNRTVGRTPSRNQLQHIYNQYKGSQSFTQQNVRPPQGGTLSDGKLNVPPSSPNPPQHIPVEKVAGDTSANNQLTTNQIPIKEQSMGHNIGDAHISNKPQGDAPMKPSSPIPSRQAKLRNGLQDVVYTSYPSSAAWSFHGTNTYRPASVGYRFRNIS